MTTGDKNLFTRTEVIGKGKFGVVYKGHHKRTKETVAIKVLDLDTDQDEVIDVQREIQFLSELKNVPNVTHYYESFLINTKLWIIMDYCEGGSVRTLLRAGVFEEKYISVLLRELLSGLLAVHSMGVIHRDLKSANVLISKEGNVRLCDFGVASQLTCNAYKRTTMAGTTYWMAPEVIREGDGYNFKADIWSLGITLFEIATGNPPYSDKDSMWAMQLISRLKPPRLEGREYSPILKECIALCLDENPEERPSADELSKCRLVKTYKNLPTSILKEVITHYLLWRDRHLSRDSFSQTGVEEVLESGKEDDQEKDHLQVKWDFDSLSSREYIEDNNIDISEVQKMEDYDDHTDHNVIYDDNNAHSTIQMQKHKVNHDSTHTLGEKDKTDVNDTKQDRSSDKVPKSLQLLFEDSPDLSISGNNEAHQNFELPQRKVIDERPAESPTIEIPDVDDFETYVLNKETKQASMQLQKPHFNKPPALMHSQSASGKLEMAASIEDLNNNPKKGLNGTLAEIPEQLYQQSQNNSFSIGKTNGSDLTTNENLQFTSSLPNVKTSPSKIMKPLQSNSNPLLQPINGKLQTESSQKSTEDSKGSPGLGGPQQQTWQQSQNNVPLGKSKKGRLGLRIHMPSPHTIRSTSISKAFDTPDEDINQFGISASQIGKQTTTMTPLTEKENNYFNPSDSANEQDGQNNQRLGSAQANAQNSSQGNVQPQTIQNTSTNHSKSVLTSHSPSFAGKTIATKFPSIPSINNDLFLDLTPKQKLVGDLKNLIKLFDQGLEALEDVL